MAAYDSLKSLVQQAIRTNGNNEITGQVLQNVLMAMIDELGGENGYAGVATPSTNPGAPDGKVFYFATEAGTYTHFDGATLAKGIHLLVFNGVTWSHQTLYTIDSEVTSGSNNLITSGAVYTKIINAINALDATVSKSAGADGLSLSLTETDGKVTNISGSIAPQTYDAYGAASAAQIAASTDATNKVSAAKTQILGDAASDYNTLGKLEDKIQAEASRAAAAENALNTDKADKATTLAGYGINDAYTKTEVNGLVSTPHQNYVTVPTYASLPATGSADTIYRVSNYNGSTSQVDASVYSEYAWNGSGYTFLRVVSQIGEVFDITVYNSNTKYADLAAALGTNGANVPSSIRRGGMSVKFVQSSDNNYVQFRCKTQTFSANPNDWYFEGDDTLADNPEYLRAITDSAGHLLAWIRVDGGIDWAVGVPKPVKDYVGTEIAKILNGSASTDIDGINKIIAFLDNFSTSDTLAELLATKVDKENGKSLIDAEYANGVHYIENPEFIYVKTDNEDKILWAIKKDGGIYYGAGCPQQVKDYIEEKISSLSLDEYEDIVAFLSYYLGSDTTLKAMIDGINAQIATKVDKVEGKSLIDAEFAEGVSQTENPEFAEVHTDADNKVLYGVKQDGDFYFGAGIPSQIKEELDEKVDKEDGKSLIDEGVAASQSVIEDHEFMQVEVDSEDKILGGRKTDGTQFENMPIETPSVIIKSIDDPENRTFIGLDANKRIITYRDEYGVLHEEAGIKSPTIDNILGRESSVENFILYQIELLKRNSPYSLAYANSYNHLNIVPYNDVQQVVHPKILYFSEALFGHKFWGAVTPYPKGNTLMENPCIIYSDDGYNWYGIAGNPIALPPDTSNFRKYNSDTHLVYRNDTDKLECWYRYCDEDTLKESIKRKVSFDGYIWGEEETLISFDNNSVGNALSPCVNWNTNHYDVWVVKSYGNNNFAIDYYTTVTGYDFQFVRKIELNYIYNNEEFFVWHIDVIQDSGLFIIVAMCKSKTTDKWILFITTSQDNITYSTPEVIMVGSNRWDGQMYRSSIVKVGNEYFLYYSARDNGINKNYYTSLSVSNTLSNFVGKINLNF